VSEGENPEGIVPSEEAMLQEYFLAFFIPLTVTAFVTPLVKYLATTLKVLDFPDEARKIQDRPVPKLGGLAVYAGFAFTVALWLIFSPRSFGYFIHLRYLLGILAGGAILMVGGYLDDRYDLRPARQIIFPLLAIACLIVSGIQLSYINNPLGGAILLDTVKILGYPLLGGVFIVLWVLGMIYTTKFLDGMDGLVSGVTGIGAVVVFFLSLLPNVSQPDTALLALMFGGAILGFLPWNFHPARIFLGESGSTLAGFLIGTLSVIAGGKIATALLIMGIPILDVVWVIVRRVYNHFSPFAADRKHLHFRLLDVGLSQRQTVLFLFALSAGFGISGLYLQSVGKLLALVILCLVMLLLGAALVVAYNRKMQKSKVKSQNV
jgi:UDP-GlcNAc:undecaprenyl-phosphate GlcNAc-1-phosphate transferase